MIKVTDYYTPDCGPCKSLAIILDKIDYENDDVELVKVDCEQDWNAVMEKNIRAVPTLIITAKCGDEIRLNGLRTESDILEVIDSLR
jgi:thioredoxin-like negative regulator of GroEL